MESGAGTRHAEPASIGTTFRYQASGSRPVARAIRAPFGGAGRAGGQDHHPALLGRRIDRSLELLVAQFRERAPGRDALGALRRRVAHDRGELLVVHEHTRPLPLQHAVQLSAETTCSASAHVRPAWRTRTSTRPALRRSGTGSRCAHPLEPAARRSRAQARWFADPGRPADRPVRVDHRHLVRSRDRIHRRRRWPVWCPTVQRKTCSHEPVRADRAKHPSSRQHRNRLDPRLQGKPHGANLIGRRRTGGVAGEVRYGESVIAHLGFLQRARWRGACRIGRGRAVGCGDDGTQASTRHRPRRTTSTSRIRPAAASAT